MTARRLATVVAVSLVLTAAGAGVPAAAERAVQRGEWPEDRAAAAFLSGENGPSPGVRARARAALHGESWFQHGLRRSAEAIAGGGDRR